MNSNINTKKFEFECLCFSKNIEDIEEDFNKINIDDTHENYLFKSKYLGLVLYKFLLNQFNLDALQRWANLIEFNENIIFLEQEKHYINEVIFQLANPDISNDLSTEKIKKIIVEILCA